MDANSPKDPDDLNESSSSDENESESEDQLSTLRDDFDAFKRKTKHVVHALNESTKALKKQNESVSKELINAQQNAKTEAERATTLRARLEEASDTIASLRSAAAVHLASKSDAEIRLHKSTSESAETAALLNVANERVSSLEAAADDVGRLVTSLEAEKRVVEEERDALQAKILSLTDVVDRAKKKKKQSSEEASVLKSTLTTQLDDLTTENVDLRSENEKLSLYAEEIVSNATLQESVRAQLDAARMRAEAFDAERADAARLVEKVSSEKEAQMNAFTKKIHEITLELEEERAKNESLRNATPSRPSSPRAEVVGSAKSATAESDVPTVAHEASRKQRVVVDDQMTVKRLHVLSEENARLRTELAGTRRRFRPSTDETQTPSVSATNDAHVLVERANDATRNAKAHAVRLAAALDETDVDSNRSVALLKRVVDAWKTLDKTTVEIEWSIDAALSAVRHTTRSSSTTSRATRDRMSYLFSQRARARACPHPTHTRSPTDSALNKMLDEGAHTKGGRTAQLRQGLEALERSMKDSSAKRTELARKVSLACDVLAKRDSWRRGSSEGSGGWRSCLARICALLGAESDVGGDLESTRLEMSATPIRPSRRRREYDHVGST